MDKNTTIGLVLMGLLLTVFTIINQPSDEDLKKAKEIAKNKKEQKKTEDKKNEGDNKTVVVKKETSNTTKNDKTKVIQTSKTYVLENDDLEVTLDSKGAMVTKVVLKKFRTYKAFMAKKDEGLVLFKSGDASNFLVIKDQGKTMRTNHHFFEVTPSKNSISFKLDHPDGKQPLVITYSLAEGQQLDYSIELGGYEAANTQLAWYADLKKTERLVKEQRRTTTVCFNQTTEGLDYLSESSDAGADAEDNIDWVAYKQSYFSSILHPNKPFDKKNTSFYIKNFGDGHPKAFSHLKSMKSLMTLPKGEDKISFKWYFGSNDYHKLLAYNEGYDDILNYGWGLFRWINLYAVEPIFNLLLNLGVAVGLAILLLTIVLKLILMPIQWKMFVSSVKMKILKPEIDALNEKFPGQENAMKKQVEMMSLYKESGASPLAGCVPMLIQMPILLAVFRYFPASFSLRQKPFLWAEDLSSYDSILDFGFNLWPYGDHVSLFTLLMALTTVLYTYMNSGNMQQPTQPGMPNMKVMMYVFPIMMIFFFNDFSSGLSYYYFISTLISILMMVAIKRFFVDEDKLRLKMEAKKAANKSGEPKKKSKFQERLEEMQKKSTELQKSRKK